MSRKILLPLGAGDFSNASLYLYHLATLGTNQVTLTIWMIFLAPDLKLVKIFLGHLNLILAFHTTIDNDILCLIHSLLQ